MATHRITTPAPGHTGQIGNVMFKDGVAEIDAEQHAAELRYFQAQGYGVEELAAEDTKTTRGRRAASTSEEPAK